jgi:alkaline phosphatase D
MTRRKLLAVLSALPVLSRTPSPAQTRTPKLAGYPFQLGVACGEPDPHGFALWTRLAPKPLEGGGMPADDVQVDWQVAEDERFAKVVASGSETARRELAHAVHVEVAGLQPDRWYFYRFRAGSEISPVARARTTPPPDVTPAKLRFAFASCQHYESGYFTALRHMAAEDLDLVAHLGDYIYEGKGQDGRPRKHAGGEIVTLEDYRTRHAQYKSDSDLQAAHHACPWLVTWDDHEVDNNYADGTSEEQRVSADDFLTRRAHAYQAYYEHMPLRLGAKPVGHDMRLYRNVSFGRLAEFAVLDTRQYRTDQPCGDRNVVACDGVFDPKATLLGDAQEQWLQQTLQRSPAVWNVLAQQIMFGRADRDPGPDVTWSMDQWSGYDVARNRLLAFLRDERIRNPVVLTGDIHSNWVNDLKVDFGKPESPTVATELVGTSIASGGDGVAVDDYVTAILDQNPFVRFFNKERGYVSCTVTPSEWRADYQVVEKVSEKGAPLITRASFRVEDGKAGAQRA